jgi:molybdate transport system substrate-binding protein
MNSRNNSSITTAPRAVQTVFRVVAIFSACLLLTAMPSRDAHAADIKVLAGSALEPVFAAIIPEFERSSAHKILLDSDGAIGAMTDRIEKGEVADVVIVSGTQIDRLEKQGRVATGSRTDLARVGVGVFVRKGAPKPDIESVDSFKRTMLASKSIGYNDPAAGAPVSIYLLGVFEKMGIAAEMKAKTVVFTKRTERFAPVARGEVEIGFNQISEILAAPGVDLAGSLPAGIQNYTQFSAGIVANGKQGAAARTFIEFMASPGARALMKTKGFE